MGQADFFYVVQEGKFEITVREELMRDWPAPRRYTALFLDSVSRGEAAGPGDLERPAELPCPAPGWPTSPSMAELNV